MQSGFVILDRMFDRVERAREDSESASFDDLMYFGEFTLKVIVAEIVAALDDDREQHRYDLEYRLVRANGIGEWNRALYDALTGPANLQLVAEARTSAQALTEKFGPGSDTWQRRAIDALSVACDAVEAGKGGDTRRKRSMRDWCDMFVWLRNRTRGHGATTPTTKGSACVALSESLGAIVAGYPGFRRPWAHLHRNLSGKYRVSHLSDEKVPFAHLKNEDSHTFANGTYIVFDRPRFCALLITDADLNDFFVPNGQGSAIGFEVLSYLTDDQQTVKTDRYSLPAAARAQSETAARQGLDVGNLLTNMPGTREHYVARPHLEGELVSACWMTGTR